MLNFLKARHALGSAALALGLCLLSSPAMADTLPSGDRTHGNAGIEPAYNFSDGTIVYLLTPERLAPLGPDNPLLNLPPSAISPMYLVVYPAGTPGVFNCMGVPGNCPDHDGAIAGVATGLESSVYGTDPTLVPGHDHLVAGRGTAGYNTARHVHIELFTSSAAVTHITMLSQLQAAWASGGLRDVDSGITFLAPIVSRASYLAGTP